MDASFHRRRRFFFFDNFVNLSRKLPRLFGSDLANPLLEGGNLRIAIPCPSHDVISVRMLARHANFIIGAKWFSYVARVRWPDCLSYSSLPLGAQSIFNERAAATSIRAQGSQSIDGASRLAGDAHPPG